MLLAYRMAYVACVRVSESVRFVTIINLNKKIVVAAGCHAGGGNVVQGGASLFSEDLRRNGVQDSQAIYDLIYSGKGKMPGYGQDCAPRVRYT